MYIMESPPGPITIINGREVDYFCGCGYFAFQSHPELLQAACEAMKKFGMSSATSRSGYGNNPILVDVEKKAADFFGTENALYFVSGYLGNSILLQGLDDQYEMIFVDEESHYSVMDGIALANKPFVQFAHLDAEDLKKKVKQNLGPSQRPLLICDGVFPISGEISPIHEYSNFLEQIDGFIICVDDAHATGVLGKNGRGSIEYLELRREQVYSSGTLSKALGGHGGIIAGDTDFIEKLRGRSNIPNCSSPPPIPAAAATAKALEILINNPGLRAQLHSNVAYAKEGLRELGFDIKSTPVPIICLHSRKGSDLRALQQELFKRGIAVLYVAGGSYSSVPKSGAIRIAIFSSHTQEQIDHLIDEIKHRV